MPKFIFSKYKNVLHVEATNAFNAIDWTQKNTKDKLLLNGKWGSTENVDIKPPKHILMIKAVFV